MASWWSGQQNQWLFEVSCIVVQAAASSSPKTGLAKIHQLKATDSVFGLEDAAAWTTMQLTSNKTKAFVSGLLSSTEAYWGSTCA